MQSDLDDDHDPDKCDDIASLTAHYIIETFTYPRMQAPPLSIEVYSATTTSGGNIVTSQRDLTGIMVWPATHLLCHYLASNKVGEYILELGCGCGMLGITSWKANHSHRLWVSTDRDPKALDLCRKNSKLNKLDIIDEASHRMLVRTLEWGNEAQIQEIFEELRLCRDGKHNHITRSDGNHKVTFFDAIVAADIVYPATCGQILQNLFRTVDLLLASGGTFWLSFATRDGARTPQRLLEAASEAGFSTDALPPLNAETKSQLPPLLDARILLFRRNPKAKEHNMTLGFADCKVFPGLRAAISRMEESSSEEEWDAPFVGVDDD